MAAASIMREGKLTDIAARAMVTLRLQTVDACHYLRKLNHIPERFLVRNGIHVPLSA